MASSPQSGHLAAIGWARHRLDGRRDVLSTPLSPNHDAILAVSSGNTSIGEYKAKLSHRDALTSRHSLLFSGNATLAKLRPSLTAGPRKRNPDTGGGEMGGACEMFDSTSSSSETEMQVIDLLSGDEFMARQIRPRGMVMEISGMRRLANAFAQRPERILQELVEVSMDMCGAESAGVTIEEAIADGLTQFRWIATAGKYAGFLGAVLPRFYSPCGTCLDRGQPQLFRVRKAYLDTIGVEAPPVTDGILIPWEVDRTRGTIWVLAHSSYQWFDSEDYRMMQSLSDFAAIAVRHQRQQATLQRQMATEAAAAMANDLAHQINNPLQGLMQTVYLAARGGAEGGVFAQQAMGDLVRLSDLVKRLLDLPRET